MKKELVFMTLAVSLFGNLVLQGLVFATGQRGKI